MNEQTMRFRVGVFVLAVMILLAVLVTLFGGFTTFLKSYTEYTVTFSDAPGVGPGTPVRRSGVRIGEVKRVALDDATGQVRVDIVVEKGHILYRDDQAVLVHGLLGGDTSIDFVTPPAAAPPPAAPPRPAAGAAPAADPPAAADPPPAAPVPAPPGTVFSGKKQTDVNALLNQTQQMLPATQETLNDMRESFQRFNRMAPQMERLIQEYRDLGKATRDVIPELRHTNDEVGKLAKAARDTIPELRQTSDEVGKLAKAARETIPELRQTNDEVGKLAKAARETIPELRRTNEEIQVTARNWGKLGERLDVLLQTNEDKLIKTLDNFNSTIVRVGNTLNDENQRNLSTTLKNVRAGSERLDSISRNADEMLKEGRQTIQRVNESVTRADSVLTNLQQAIKPIAERSSSIMKNVDESAWRLNSLLSDVTGLLSTFTKTDGTLGVCSTTRLFTTTSMTRPACWCGSCPVSTA